MATIWETTSIPSRDRLVGRVKADCTVIGAGMAGLMVAYELMERGFSVVVLEADRICSGATKRTTAKITAQHGLIYHRLIKQQGLDMARLYYECNFSGIEKFAQIIEREKIECEFKRLPAVLYAKDNSYAIVKETHAADRVNARYTYTKETDLPYSVKAALVFDNQAQFHPLEFAKAISKELRIYENSPAINIEDGKVWTPWGEVQTHYIVNTTHYPIINLPGLYFLRQHQERSYALNVKTAKKLEAVYYGIDDNRSLRSCSSGVIICGEKHRTGGNAKGGCLCRLREFAQTYYPDKEIENIWSNQDAITHDGVAFIGRYSSFAPRMFVATGFNKWGMSLCGVSSQLIADLICGKKNDYERLYTPNRFRLRAAAGKLAADVGYSVAGLCAGLQSDKEHRCTHLGAKLKYNSDEGTWECPLHGSQFDKQGNVIFSPAQKDIPHGDG